MTAPLALDRVKALLRRLSPTFPTTDPDSSAGKELDSIALALGMAADAVDSLAIELFPDTAAQTIERWEFITKNPTRISDAISLRQGRVLSVLRRSAGAGLDQLAAVLAVPLALSMDDILFIEQTRQFIDDATKLTSPTLNAPMPCTASMLSHFPDQVDDTGIRLTITMSTYASPGASLTLTSPNGLTWSFAQTAASASYENRTAFLGETAGGVWTLAIADTAGGQTLVTWVMRISNTMDSGQIYNFFAFRDPTLPGTPDLVGAQQLFQGTALGHMRALVIQSMEFLCDDPYSLCDRDPLGV